MPLPSWASIDDPSRKPRAGSFAALLLALAAALPACLPGSSVARYRIQGTVLDLEGKPLEGAAVSVRFPARFESQGNLADELTGNKREQTFTARTGGDGRFTLEAEAVHHVTFILPGALLLAVTVLPVVALTPFTREDVPGWVWGIARFPPPGPHPWGTMVSVEHGRTFQVVLDPRRHEVAARRERTFDRLYDVGRIPIDTSPQIVPQGEKRRVP